MRVPKPLDFHRLAICDGVGGDGGNITPYGICLNRGKDGLSRQIETFALTLPFW